MADLVVNLRDGDDQSSRMEATGESFALREWSGSGPAELHVHHADDEAWCILAGTVRFRFADGEVVAGVGSTVFVPAGTPHTFVAISPDTRYLLILTKRLVSLINSLQSGPSGEAKAQVYRDHASELLE